MGTDYLHFSAHKIIEIFNERIAFHFRLFDSWFLYSCNCLLRPKRNRRKAEIKMSLIESDNRKSCVDQSEKYLRELTKTFTGIEKPLKNVKIVETLNDLITELHNVFNSDRVNIEYVNHLLLSYKSNPKEWKKFAKFDRFKWVLKMESQKQFIHREHITK